MDKIEVIPNVISVDEIETLLSDVDVKNTGTEDFYFLQETERFGLKKTKCFEHQIVKSIIERTKLTNVISASVLYYPTDSYNPPHTDNGDDKTGIGIVPWTKTCIIFLNNNFTGGELVYPNQGCVFYPSIGTMIVAPAGGDYLHYVNKITSGDRFTLVFRIV